MSLLTKLMHLNIHHQLATRSSTMVVHLTHNLKIYGLDPAAGNRGEQIVRRAQSNEFQNCH